MMVTSTPPPSKHRTKKYEAARISVKGYSQWQALKQEKQGRLSVLSLIILNQVR